MNFGLAGMLFYMWLIDNKKQTALQDVIREQVEDKKRMREDRTELIRIIESYASLNARLLEQLERIEPLLAP